MIVKLLPHQDDFLATAKRFAALVGGIGSGKTFTLSHYVINRVIKYPKALHFVGANSYSQLKNSTLSSILTTLSDLEIPYSMNWSHGMLEFAKGRVLCKSMDNFNMLRGIEVGSFIIDEARDLKKEAFDMMMGRLRDKNVGKDLQGRIVTSPAGHNWIFDYFHPNGEFHSKDFHLIQTNSMSNKHLPDGYIDSIKQQYSDKFYEQEILGEFVNLTSGKVYYSFDRNINVKETKKLPGTIYVGMDFNVDPMTAVVGQMIDGNFHVHDEIYLNNSNTFEMCDALKRRGYGGSRIIPDSTGKARKTSGKSDHIILKEAGYHVEYSPNPLVFDRVNNINRLLSNGRLIINPRCKKLINDLEKVTWKDNKLDQSTDKMLTHISDALGYACWKLLPIKERVKTQGIIFE